MREAIIIWCSVLLLLTSQRTQQLYWHLIQQTSTSSQWWRLEFTAPQKQDETEVMSGTNLHTNIHM